MSLRAIWAFDTTAKEVFPPFHADKSPDRGFIVQRTQDAAAEPCQLWDWKAGAIPSLWLFEDGYCKSVVYFHPEKELVVGIPGPEGKKYLEKVLGIE